MDSGLLTHTEEAITYTTINPNSQSKAGLCQIAVLFYPLLIFTFSLRLDEIMFIKFFKIARKGNYLFI